MVLKKVRQGSPEEEVKREIAEIEATVQNKTTYSEIVKTLFEWHIFKRYAL